MCKLADQDFFFSSFQSPAISIFYFFYVFKVFLIPFPRTHTADTVPLANCSTLAVTAGVFILAAKNWADLYNLQHIYSADLIYGEF